MKHLKKAALAAITASLLLTGCGPTAPETPVEPLVTESASASMSASATPTDTENPTQAPAETKTATAQPEPSQAAQAGTAVAMLETLPVSDDQMSGYKRDLFDHWTDPDGTGCDAREDTLAVHMVDVVAPDGCKVQSGVLKDSYTGQTVQYIAGDGGGIDIDHVIALSAGWKTGMGNASETVREQFANDPLNLLPVDAGVNRAKGDKDASEWVPSTHDLGIVEADCPYVARQIAVKEKYSLWVTSAEKAAMANVLSDCPNEPAPTDDTFPDKPAAGEKPATVPSEPAETAAPKADAKADGSTDPDMGSCAKAKAAGYGPYVKGTDVEYDYYRDGDGDGTVCE